MKQDDLKELEKNETDEKKARTLAELSETVWLTPDNASFFQKNGFLYVKALDAEPLRAFLCRQFPQELLWEFISVLDDDQHEIGIIRDLSSFGADTHGLLKTELERRYYAPTVQKILGVKERYGFSYWKVETENGALEFTVKDTFRSILHAVDGRLIILDVNGNRFQIPNVSALDKKSYKKIELYL